ncbi:unnamed protein product [Mycena citricolor]|nr:unnamed protein product [Mycena citricolor]
MRKILFGDSMPAEFRYTLPKKLLRGLQHWAQHRFENTFSCELDGLRHGTQLDAFSCGLVAMNTCELAVYPDTAMWSPEDAVRYRVGRFNEYIDSLKALPSDSALTTATVHPVDIIAPAEKHEEIQNLTLVSESRISIRQLLNPLPNRQRPASVLTTSTASMGDCTDADVLLGRNGSEDEQSEVAIDENEERDDGDEESSEDDGNRDACAAVLPRQDVSTSSTLTVTPKSRQMTLGSFFNLSGVKRKAVESEIPGHSKPPTQKKSRTHAIKIHTPRFEGNSRTTKWSNNIKQLFMQNKFIVAPKDYDKWKHEIWALDPHAEFHPLPESMMTWENFRTIRHAKCGTKVKVKRPYDVSRYRDHLNNGCPVMHDGAGMQTLFAHFSEGCRFTGTALYSPEKVDCQFEPCPGVTEMDIPHVDQYLKRTGAPPQGPPIIT